MVHGDSDFYTFENLHAAWRVFRRGKGTRPDVIAFEHNVETKLFQLLSELRGGYYRHGSYAPFTVFDPKQRRIHKASVRDRIVHQLLVTALETQFETRFIYDSFSCRPGKGTHAAVKRLRQQLHSASHNNSQKVYILKCDVQQFFASVDQALLTSLVTRRIANPAHLQLTSKVLASFTNEPGKGMPLGNVTSQLFANIYLHELDWFVKQQLGERYYIRYCDDFIIASTSRQHLLDLIPRLRTFLADELYLTLHPTKISLRSWQQGIDFLGYVLKPDCTILRTKTRRRMLQRVNTTNKTSYTGLCTHANSHRLKQLLDIVTWEIE